MRTLTWSRVQTLLLVVEVLSPSSVKADRFLKRLRYREAGVPLYWVVDADDRSVEIWTPRDDFPGSSVIASAGSRSAPPSPSS